jgi:hypothetical protein
MDVDGIHVFPDSRNGWEVDEHRYPVIELEGTEYVADPTWKQFLPESVDASDLPDVLFGTRDQVVDYAKQHGVSVFNAQLWQPKTANPQPERVLSPAERIAQAVDAQP